MINVAMVYPTIPLTKRRLLIVDKNTQLRQYIARTLEIEGYTVMQAADGSIAANLMEHTIPDLILSEINLTDLIGVDFFQATRRDKRLLTIPFIFTSTEDISESVQSRHQISAEGILNKPFEPRDLVQLVNSRLLRAAAVQIALMDQAYLETVTVLAKTIEGRDQTTSDHVERVTALARSMAEILHWPEDQLRNLEFGARLHDIGKIIIPDQILNKPGPLNDEEWEIMKSHTTAGANILREIRHLKGAVPYALYHHERWDGDGYPYRLRGREIPLEGRLLAVVDCFDALTSDRPYRPAESADHALAIITGESGKQFDPDLVAIFIELVQSEA